MADRGESEEEDGEEGEDVNVRGCNGCWRGGEVDDEVWIDGRVIIGMAGNDGAGIDEEDAGL